MTLPIDTCENGSCSFAIRGEYDKRVYAKNLGLGGGTSRQHRCVWCINCVDGCASTLTQPTTKRGGATFSAQGRARCLQRPSS